jgi:magnesium transporter
VIKGLGEMFSLHDLSLEDVVSRNQRPKLEPYDDHLYIVAPAVARNVGIEFEQVNIFVGKNYVLTFQEGKADWQEPVLKRIRAGRTRIRRLGANYLCYALLDSIVDHYFPILEEYGERLDRLEEEVLLSPANDEIVRTHEIRNEILTLRRAIAPLKDVVNTLARDEMSLISAETRLYFRDLCDNISHLFDTIEMDREIARSLVELCMTSISNRMNEVMKVLTVIATIFIPLGFIAGLYGMNFRSEASPLNMPELGWYFGYPFALSLMALTALGLLFFFKRKGWLGK